MKKIFSFSLLLILGLVASQILPGMLGEGYPAFRAGDWLYGTEDPGLILRPALHSYMLTMTHPVTGELLHFTAPIPADMQALI